LPDAVAACTSRPAARFGLTGRGVLAPGAFADVVIIDHSRFRDQATYLVPQKSPPGLTAVLVNGQQTVRDGRLTGTRAGAVL
jgi:N-acyl-D-amino-acid deacylase